MNYNELFEKLASDNSRIFKTQMLKQYEGDEILKKIIFLALDPFTQFYIRKIPSYTAAQENQADSLDSVLDSLNMLSSRQVTGNAGIAHLTKLLSSLVESDAKVIERIIKKDLKCGVSAATVNSVWPNLIHEYPCMLASGYDQKLVDKVKFPAIAQLKLDGMRFNAIVKLNEISTTVEFRSRNGKEIEVNDYIFGLPFTNMAEFYGCDMVFDGELLVVDSAGKVCSRQEGNGILNKAVKGTQSSEEGSRVRATLWDAIPLEHFEKGVYKEKYFDRFAKLSNCVNDLRTKYSNISHLVDLAPTKHVDNLHEAKVLFEKYLSEGQEGIILKTKDGIWEDKRSKNLIKFKGELECDLKVVGWVEGTGKYQGMMGALELASSDNIVQVRLGTGFSDDDRKQITRDIVGKIVAVKYNAKITDKNGEVSLFLPVYIETREDKDVADSNGDIK